MDGSAGFGKRGNHSRLLTMSNMGAGAAANVLSRRIYYGCVLRPKFLVHMRAEMNLLLEWLFPVGMPPKGLTLVVQIREDGSMQGAARGHGFRRAALLTRRW